MSIGTAVPVALEKVEGLAEPMPNTERDQLRVRMFAVLEQAGTLSTQRGNRATRVLSHLIGACDVQGRAHIRQTTLAERTHSTVRTVQRALSDLEAVGLIERTRATKRLRHRDSNAEGASLYQLLDPARDVVVPDVIPAAWSTSTEGQSWRQKVAESVTESDTTEAESVTKSDTTPEPSDTTPDTTRHDRLSYGTRQPVVPSSCFSYKEQEHSSDAETALAVASGADAAQHEQYLLGATPDDASAAAAVSVPAPEGAVTSPAADAVTSDQVDTVKLYQLIESGLPSLTPQALSFAVDVLRSRPDGLEKATELVNRSKSKSNPPGYFASAIKGEAANPSPCQGAKPQAPKEARPIYHNDVAANQAYFATLEENYTEQTEPAWGWNGESRDPDQRKARSMGRIYVAMLKAGKSHAEVGAMFSQLENVDTDDVPAYLEACENHVIRCGEGVGPDADDFDQQLDRVAEATLEARADWAETEIALDYAAERSYNGEPFPATAIARRIEKATEAATGTVRAQLGAECDALDAAHTAQRPATPLRDEWKAAYNAAHTRWLSKYAVGSWLQLSSEERITELGYFAFDADGFRAARSTEQYQAELTALTKWQEAAPTTVLSVPSWPEYVATVGANPIGKLDDLIWSRSHYEIGTHGSWPVWMLHVYQHYGCTITPGVDCDTELGAVTIGKRRPRPLTLEDAAESAGIAVDLAHEKHQRTVERTNRTHDQDDY